METVYTLYRVSTKKQVDKQKDDIPMQREACQEFAERMGWTIGKTKLNMEMRKYNNQLEKLNTEIADSLTGESVYSPEQLSAAINSVNQKISETKSQLEILQNEVENRKAAMEKVKPAYERFTSWAEEFSEASTERKKMIISQLASKIEISRGYKIHIELNADYERFCEGLNGLESIVANKS